jgi:hypothetical protein
MFNLPSRIERIKLAAYRLNSVLRDHEESDWNLPVAKQTVGKKENEWPTNVQDAVNRFSGATAAALK